MIGARYHVCRFICANLLRLKVVLENMASHRAQTLSQLLPLAFAYGASEMEPEFEPLKVRDLSPRLLETGAYLENH
jgi:hypothetical protein